MSVTAIQPLAQPQFLRANPVTAGDPSAGLGQGLGDRFTGSRDLLANPMAAGMGLAQNLSGGLMDGILKSSAQQIIQGLSQGQDVTKQAEQLGQEYQHAKEMGMPLSPQTEALVKQALEAAGVGAPQGAAPQGGGGAPQGGGGAPQGGGGAPQGGGGASQGGGGASQGGQSGGAERPQRSSSSTPTHTNSTPRATTSAGAPEASVPGDANDLPVDHAAGEAQAEWGRQFQPGQSIQPPRFDSEEQMMSSFGQGKNANCGLTAVIKGSMAPAGPQLSATRTEEGFMVRHLDGKDVAVSDAEVRRAAELSGYTGNPEGTGWANMVLASSAKLMANGGDFEKSLVKLANPVGKHSQEELGERMWIGEAAPKIGGVLEPRKAGPGEVQLESSCVPETRDGLHSAARKGSKQDVAGTVESVAPGKVKSPGGQSGPVCESGTLARPATTGSQNPSTRTRSAETSASRTSSSTTPARAGSQGGSTVTARPKTSSTRTATRPSSTKKAA